MKQEILKFLKEQIFFGKFRDKDNSCTLFLGQKNKTFSFFFLHSQ